MSSDLLTWRHFWEVSLCFSMSFCWAVNCDCWVDTCLRSSSFCCRKREKLSRLFATNKISVFDAIVSVYCSFFHQDLPVVSLRCDCLCVPPSCGPRPLSGRPCLSCCTGTVTAEGGTPYCPSYSDSQGRALCTPTERKQNNVISVYKISSQCTPIEKTNIEKTKLTINN